MLVFQLKKFQATVRFNKRKFPLPLEEECCRSLLFGLVDLTATY
jgi:hypothetical protein